MSDKPRGYAFIEFEHKKDFISKKSKKCFTKLNLPPSPTPDPLTPLSLLLFFMLNTSKEGFK